MVGLLEKDPFRGESDVEEVVYHLESLNEATNELKLVDDNGDKPKGRIFLPKEDHLLELTKEIREKWMEESGDITVTVKSLCNRRQVSDFDFFPYEEDGEGEGDSEKDEDSEEDED